MHQQAVLLFTIRSVDHLLCHDEITNVVLNISRQSSTYNVMNLVFKIRLQVFVDKWLLNDISHLSVGAQGPALYAYNDAGFTEQDWTGIRMLQDSIKETDSTKIGRFGLGFKSVFHLTGNLSRDSVL